MIQLAAGAMVVAGAVACLTARHAAIVAVGVAMLLGASPLLTQPVPGALLLSERAVGAALAAELVWLGLRGRPVADASALGWPPLTLIALAAVAAGVGAQRLIPVAGQHEALGVALALFTVAIVAIAGRSDGVHLGLSALVAVAATSAVRIALSGPVSPLETLLVAGLGVCLAGAVALLVTHEEGARPPARAAAGAQPDGTDAIRAGGRVSATPALPGGPAARADSLRGLRSRGRR